MMVEIFCGILSGANFGPNIRQWKEAHREANLVNIIITHTSQILNIDLAIQFSKIFGQFRNKFWKFETMYYH